MYLFRRRGNGPIHIWNGRDTACRMASTGGLKLTGYEVCDVPGDRELCQMCERKYNQQTRGGDAPPNQETRFALMEFEALKLVEKTCPNLSAAERETVAKKIVAITKQALREPSVRRG
jgi:hypothetical protein